MNVNLADVSLCFQPIKGKVSRKIVSSFTHTLVLYDPISYVEHKRSLVAFFNVIKVKKDWELKMTETIIKWIVAHEPSGSLMIFNRVFFLSF